MTTIYCKNTYVRQEVIDLISDRVYLPDLRTVNGSDLELDFRPSETLLDALYAEFTDEDFQISL